MNYTFLEENGQLGRVMAFMTGLEWEPPLGLNPKLIITFVHPEDEADEHLRGLGDANTCANQLSLPVGLTYDQLKKSAPYINIPCRCPISQMLKKFQAQTVLIAQTKFYDP